MKKYILLGGLLLLSFLHAVRSDRQSAQRWADWCRELRQSGNGGENDCLSVLYESGIG